MGTGGKRDRAQREGRASARNGVGGGKADATEAPTNKTSINYPEEKEKQAKKKGRAQKAERERETIGTRKSSRNRG